MVIATISDDVPGAASDRTSGLWKPVGRTDAVAYGGLVTFTYVFGHQPGAPVPVVET